jgi:hypothetical protein
MMQKPNFNYYRHIVFIVVGLLCIGSAQAVSADSARMVLVLDASGSMWGQIDGKAKIEIAKEVMAELIDSIPSDQTGLMVYGHRREGDCHDIDPCQLAAELAMSGVDFTVRVIGFDISKEDQGRLRCLADKTGGLFLAADNAGALRDALFKTVAEVKTPPAPVVEEPGTAVVKGPASVPVGSAFKASRKGRTAAATISPLRSPIRPRAVM